MTFDGPGRFAAVNRVQVLGQRIASHEAPHGGPDFRKSFTLAHTYSCKEGETEGLGGVAVVETEGAAKPLRPMHNTFACPLAAPGFMSLSLPKIHRRRKIRSVEVLKRKWWLKNRAMHD